MLRRALVMYVAAYQAMKSASKDERSRAESDSCIAAAGALGERLLKEGIKEPDISKHEETEVDAKRWRMLRGLSHHKVLEVIGSDWGEWETRIDEWIKITEG